MDESLFGPSDSGAGRTKGKTVTSDPSAASVILTQSEIRNIHQRTIIRSEADLMRERDERERIKAEKEHLARARKARMIALSAHAKKNVKKSDIEVAESAKRAQIRKMAASQRDRDSDVCKLLASYGCRASAFSVRDDQVMDRHQREKMQREYDMKMDTIMEIDRVNDLRRREEEEATKSRSRREDGKVLIEQIAARERARVLQQEAKEQESLVIKSRMAKYKDEDLEEERIRKIEQEKSRIEVMRANEAAIAKKQADRDFEKKEIADILLYQAEQDAKMAAREAEEAELIAAKNKRQKELLDMQEKSQNKAAELDELRARRAMEQKERNARKKERDEALKRRNDTLQLLSDRSKQAQDKLKTKEMERQRDEYEWQQQLMHTAKYATRDADEAAAKHTANMRHRELLSEQIESDAQRKAASRGDELDAGAKFRQELIHDEARFSVIRDQMVDELLRQGVNPKYVADMQKLDVGKVLRR